MKHSAPAFEDYLKTIYGHTEWQPRPITPSVLAARLGVAPSSVTEMVKKLAAAGLVRHVPYGPLTLTPDGVIRATAVVRRHRLIETWLVRDMGYQWDEVHEEAEILEHSLSDRLLEAMYVRLGRPQHDPHGDPIPDAVGAVTRAPAVVLAPAPTGHAGTVLRISDQDSELLRALAADEIGPGSRLIVLAAVPTPDQTAADPAATGDAGGAVPPDGGVAVRLEDGRTRELSPAAAGMIWLSA